MRISTYIIFRINQQFAEIRTGDLTWVSAAMIQLLINLQKYTYVLVKAELMLNSTPTSKRTKSFELSNAKQE